MDMVYLGLFQKIFNWVYDKILEPVVSFIGDLLSTVFSYLFEKVLLPVLEFVLKEVLRWLGKLIMDLLGEIFYRIFSYLLTLIDYISKGFDIFIGTTNVSYYDTAAKASKSGTLLEAIFAIEGIGTAFRLITAIGMGIALLVAIYAIIKSTLDFDFENKRPVGAVLRSLLKCFTQFLIIPFMLMIILNIAGIVLSGINVAFSSGSQQTLGSMVFFIASLDASKTSSENISKATNASYDFKQGARGKFLENQSPYLYRDVDQVGKYFDYGDFDYFIGILVSLFLIIILIICIITFIQRLFEIVTLYLAAPLFIATTPIDDGEKFSKWRDMFIAKCFTGYGSILAMKLYMVICPAIIDNSIQFGSAGSSMESSYLLKLIFLIGGAWAFLKVGPMITTLLNYQAGMSENQSSAMATGMMMQYVVSPAKRGAMSLFHEGKSHKSKKSDNGKEQSGERKAPTDSNRWASAKASGQTWQGDQRQRGGRYLDNVQIGFHRKTAAIHSVKLGQMAESKWVRGDSMRLPTESRWVSGVGKKSQSAKFGGSGDELTAATRDSSKDKRNGESDKKEETSKF